MYNFLLHFIDMLSSVFSIIYNYFLTNCTIFRLETIVNTFTEKKSLENELLIILQKRSWTLYILGWRQIQSVSIIYFSHQ